MKEIFSIAAGLVALYGYLPYAVDTVKGRAKPARSARLMFALLLVITLLQQKALNSGWLLAMTVGEAIGSIAILMLAFRKGLGGLRRIDMFCYMLLAVDILVWHSTGSALLALHLSVLADLIAFVPTLVKTWRQPWTETPLFFVFGTIAAPINILAAGKYSYAVLLFPVYLMLANSFELFLIVFRQKAVPKPLA